MFITIVSESHRGKADHAEHERNVASHDSLNKGVDDDPHDIHDKMRKIMTVACVGDRVMRS